MFLVTILSISSNSFANDEYSTVEDLISAIRNNNDHKALEIMKEPSVNVNGMNKSQSSSPLIEAILKNKYTLVVQLLKHGANPNKHNISGSSPLHIAARKGFNQIVDLLVHKGASIDALDKINRTPLIIASIYNNVNTIEFLLKLGANKSIRDINGNDALIYSVKEENIKSINTLFTCNNELISNIHIIIEAAKKKNKSVRTHVKQLLENCLNKNNIE